jgi:hypothetical protein
MPKRSSNNVSFFSFLPQPRRLRRALLTSVLCLIAFAANPLSAQIDTGGVTGTVTDPSGAIVPNVQLR